MKVNIFPAVTIALTLASTTWAGTLTVADTALEGRIVGGKAVDITAHPHQVSLRYKSINFPGNSYSHRCGGALISEYHVVTAAHCVIAKVPSQYQAVAGANHRRSGDGAVAIVKEIIMHEDYVPRTYENDIALMVLATPMPINNVTIKPVELTDKPPSISAIATITGWGAFVYNGAPATLLQEVKVPIVSNELCNEDYGPGRITENMLCAGLRGIGGKDACQGDSGGPLLVNGKLTGVVSWGYGCADKEYPGVYTNVSYFLPWLHEKIAETEAMRLLEN